MLLPLSPLLAFLALSAASSSATVDFSSPFPDAELTMGRDCRMQLDAYFERADSWFDSETYNKSDDWAIKMYDAGGKAPSGFFEGNINAIGSYASCIELDVTNPYLASEPNTTVKPFKGAYSEAFVFHVGMGLLNKTDGDVDDVLMELTAVVEKAAAAGAANDEGIDQANMIISGNVLPDWLQPSVIRYGMCLPDTCTKEDFALYLNNRMWTHLRTDKFFYYGITFDPVTADNPGEIDTWQDYFMVSLLAIFGFLAIAGTAVDRLVKPEDIKDNRLYQFLAGCSGERNLRRLLDATPTKNPDHLTCLNGIRFMSMSWVLLSHTLGIFQLQVPINNLLSVTDYFGTFLAQAVVNGYPSVDSFFFISGLLVAYLTFKELDRTNGFFNVPMFYLHRYIRLTGVYAVVMLFHVSLYDFLIFGPQQVIPADMESCNIGIWRHILYINNIRPITPDPDYEYGNCMGQAWYLATDMQMFIITPLIMYPMWKLRGYWDLDYIWAALWGLASTISLIVLTIVNGWGASPTTDNTDTYFYRNYYMPWTRFQPYLVGLVLGYILHNTKGKAVKVRPALIIAGWAMAVGMGLSVIYGLDFPTMLETQVPPSEAVNVFYGSFHRLAWGLSLAWMVWACVKGYGGYVNSFLCWEAFTPLARLTYTMYLIHDVIIQLAGMNFATVSEFTPFLGTLVILWVLFMTVVFAIPVSAFIELPILHMEKFFFITLLGIGGGGNKKKQKKEKKETEKGKA